MSISSEFQHVVRRAFVGKLVTQIYNSAPLMSQLMAKKHMASKVKPMDAQPLPSGIEPLHLTAENKEDLRALVRKITPNFEASLWAQVKFHEQEEEKARMEREWQQARTMAQQISQQQGSWGVGALAAPSPSILAGNTAGGLVYDNQVHTPVFTNITTHATPGPIYQQVGTGFTTYGPVTPDQGLTLKAPGTPMKWVGYDAFPNMP